MSNVKGYYVRVDVPVVFNIDMKIGVTETNESRAEDEAMRIACDWLERGCYKTDLEEQLPVRLTLCDTDWMRGSITADLDFDSMEAYAELDSDFDPEDDDGPVSDIQGLMEAAQCLNEAFHDLPKDHPLNVWRETYGIAEVRDKLNSLAVYCDQTYRIMVDEQGYDLCFDWDFVPKFLENCVEDDFSVKSKNPRVLSMFWSGI